MKEQNYKIILFGTKIYQEIVLYGKNKDGVCIGTTKNCNVRFSRDSFFDDFEILVVPQGEEWKLICSDTVYFISDGLMKQTAMTLKHGTEIVLKYQSSNAELMKVSFYIDFDNMYSDFERVIEIPEQQSIAIGGKAFCNLHIQDDLVEEDTIALVKNNGNYMLKDTGTRYGVYVNGFRMEEKEKTIYDMDFFMLDGYSFYIRNSRLFTTNANTIQVNGLKEMDTMQTGNQLMYPKFQRNTRIKYIVPEEEIEVLAPKAKKEAPKRNVVMTIIPALISMVMMVFLRGAMGGGGMFVIYSAAMMGMGIATSIITYFMDGKEYRAEIKERRKEYLQYAKDKENEIKELRKKELRILEEKYISIDREIEEVERFDSRLFEKDVEDDDYLTVRVGTGTVESLSQVAYKKQEFKDTEDDLSEYPEKLADAYRYVEDAPVCINLKENNCIGIVGSKEVQYEMLKNITIDLSVRHFYHDVKFYYLFNENEQEKYTWLRWLHNVKSGVGNIRNFMYDEESRKIILEVLYEELSSREGLKEEDLKHLPHYVVFVTDAEGLAQHPVSKYVEECGKYGFNFLFFEEYEELLPKGCDKVLKMADDFATGVIVSSENGEEKQPFTYHTIPNRVAESLSLRLGCVYVDEVSLESSLTKSISLYELLGIINIDNLDIASRWRESKVYESMAAPLGVKSGDEVVSLDLNEKHHGPHGLVAGTTGSGKSEILQSYILSMATLFHPYEVGFVIIDFKGGGMVNQFKNLPHLIGAITNIDGREIDRSLLSIKAELRKRQELFADYNVNHIDAYIKKFKAGEAKIALPHLILIVDEFAELKSDQPEFMKELISAARIGRSLGVHLILATQKPSGVVDDQIWSNSKFKLCLKVQNKEDSNEVLKSPLAAEIKEPGRAYLQVGNNEIFELFQSAYSGAAADQSQVDIVKEFSVSDVNLLGKSQVIFQQKNPKSEKSATQLEAIVEYVAKYCKDNGIEHLPGICLPSLGEVIDYQLCKPAFEIESDIGAVIGIYDAPEQQLQKETFVNFSQENIFAVGASQYGKTNLLQVLIKGLAMNYTPEEVNIYILDFASMILKTFEGLSHVGGVVTSSEDEKLKNFFKMMNEEIYRRKDMLSQMGISSFSSYRDAGYRELPQIVIMVDNLTALKELYLQDNDNLLLLCREGLAVGISVVVVNSQTSGIGYKYLSNFSKRIALYCNDSSEYNSVFDHCRMQPRNVPGRGIIDIDKALYEYQTYLAFAGRKEIERVEEMKSFMAEVNARSAARAKRIPEIPAVLDSNYVAQQYPEVLQKAYQVMIGLNYSTIMPVMLQMNNLGVLGIVGKENSGRGNFVRYLLHTLQQNDEKAPVKVAIIDDVSKKYANMAQLEIVEKYTMDANYIGELLTVWEEELRMRYDAMVAGDDTVLEEAPLLLMIIQNMDALEVLQNNPTWMDLYKNITGKLKAMKVAILISNVPNANISYSSPEPLKDIKESRHLLIFDELSNQKILDVPMAIIREYKKKLEVGEGFYCKENEVVKIKSVLDVNAE